MVKEKKCKISHFYQHYEYSKVCEFIDKNRKVKWGNEYCFGNTIFFLKQEKRKISSLL